MFDGTNPFDCMVAKSDYHLKIKGCRLQADVKKSFHICSLAFVQGTFGPNLMMNDQVLSSY